MWRTPSKSQPSTTASLALEAFSITLTPILPAHFYRNQIAIREANAPPTAMLVVSIQGLFVRAHWKRILKPVLTLIGGHPALRANVAWS